MHCWNLSPNKENNRISLKVKRYSKQIHYQLPNILKLRESIVTVIPQLNVDIDKSSGSNNFCWTLINFILYASRMNKTALLEFFKAIDYFCFHCKNSLVVSPLLLYWYSLSSPLEDFWKRKYLLWGLISWWELWFIGNKIKINSFH